MKRTIFLLMSRIKAYLMLVMVAALMFSLSSCGDDDDGPAPPQTIVDVAVASGYNTLAAALIEADLVSALQADGPFTVFAPTDEAFADIQITADNVGSVDNLEAILLYHVIGDELRSTELTTGTQATLNPAASLMIDADNLTVNGIDIISPFDVEASNGIIHTIDGVLLPPAPAPEPEPLDDIVTIATNNENLTVLEEALIKFPDLVDLLSTDGSYTVFAPTDAAFTALLGVIGQNELDDIPENVLRRILEYHVVVGTAAFAADLNDGDPIETALMDENMMAETVTIGKSGMDVTVNGIDVILPDVAASNGVVHVIDEVLVPALEASIVNTVVEPAYFNKMFTTLTTAVVTADLLSALIDPESTYTLFAPTNAAFDTFISNSDFDTAADLLADPGLSGILLYHVLGAEVMSSSLPGAGEATTYASTLSNGPEDLDGDDTFLSLQIKGGANGPLLTGDVVINLDMVDIQTDNGVVHVLDGVLVPPTVVDLAAGDGGFSSLVMALMDADLVGALSAAGPPFLTVFAPTDDAFTNIGMTSAELVEILQYHVTDAGNVTRGDLSDGFVVSTLLTDEDFVVNVSMEDDVTITADASMADVIATDIQGTNGVIHVVNTVLLPE